MALNKFLAEPDVMKLICSRDYEKVLQSEGLKKLNADRFCYYLLEEWEKQLLNILFNFTVNFSPIKKVDHPVLKFVHEYYTEELIKEYQKMKPPFLILLGTKLKEYFRFYDALNSKGFSTRILAIFGEQDIKDDFRAAEDLDLITAYQTTGQLKDKEGLRESKLALMAEYMNMYRQNGFSDHFVSAKTYRKSSFRARHIVAIDSLYDISPEQLATYMDHFGSDVVSATMLQCPEIKYCKTSHMRVYDVFWTNKGLLEKMYIFHYANAYANGYVHKKKTCDAWWFHRFFNFKDIAFSYEVVQNLEGYTKIRIVRAYKGAWKSVARLPNPTNGMMRLFNPQHYVRYGKFTDVFWVDSDKVNQFVQFCLRQTVQNFEPTRMVAYLTSELRRIVIGDKEVQKEWKMDQDKFMHVVYFAILYTALIRGELFNFTSEAVKLSKDGGEREWSIVYWWHKVVDKITLKDHFRMLTDIEAFVFFKPGFIYIGESIREKPVPLTVVTEPKLPGFKLIEEPDSDSESEASSSSEEDSSDSESEDAETSEVSSVATEEADESVEAVVLPEPSAPPLDFTEDYVLDFLELVAAADAEKLGKFNSVPFEAFLDLSIGSRVAKLMTFDFKDMLDFLGVVRSSVLRKISGLSGPFWSKIRTYLVALCVCYDDLKKAIEAAYVSPTELPREKSPAVVAAKAKEKKKEKFLPLSKKDKKLFSPPLEFKPEKFDYFSKESNSAKTKLTAAGKPFFDMSQRKYVEEFENYKNSWFIKKINPSNEYSTMISNVSKVVEAMHPIKNIKAVSTEIWDSTFGSGKTTTMLKNFDPKHDLIITPFRHLMSEIREQMTTMFGIKERFPIKTYEMALSEDLGRYWRIWYDECFCLPKAYYAMTFTKAPNSHHILVGDSQQTGYLDEYGTLAVGQDLARHMSKWSIVKRNNVTRRCGVSIVKFVRDNLNSDAKTCRLEDTKLTKSIFRNDLSDFLPDALNLAFSRDSAAEMASFLDSAACTVKSAQGLTSKRVNLYIDARDMKLAANKRLVLVALTRATHHTHVVVAGEVLSKLPNGLDKIVSLHESMTQYVVAPDSWILKRQVMKERSIKEENSSVVNFSSDILKSAAGPLPDNFVESSINLMPDKVPKDMRLRIDTSKLCEKKPVVEQNLTSTKFGKTHTTKDKLNTLATIIHRSNVNFETRSKLKDARLNLAMFKQKMAKLFKKEFKIDDIRSQFYANVIEISRKYSSNAAFKNAEEALEAYQMKIREFQKTQTRAKGADTAYKDKMGQPISAWGKELGAAFQVFMRCVETRFKDALKSNIIWANGINDDELNALFKEVCEGFDVNKLFHEGMDQPEYDSGQNKRTTALEYELMKYLFGNEKFLKLFYEVLRRGLKVIGEFYSYFSVERRTSGGPETLPGNTMLLLVLLVVMIENWEDLVCVIVKGDDSSVFSKNPIKFQLMDLKNVVIFEPKRAATPLPEFCNMVLFRSWFYNYKLLVWKLCMRNFDAKGQSYTDDTITHRGGEESHSSRILTFAEYQESIKDKLKYIDSPEVRADVIKALAHFWNDPESKVESYIDQLFAFTKTSWEVFKKDLVVNEREAH